MLVESKKNFTHYTKYLFQKLNGKWVIETPILKLLSC